jgi:hypothetical protein
MTWIDVADARFLGSTGKMTPLLYHCLLSLPKTTLLIALILSPLFSFDSLLKAYLNVSSPRQTPLLGKKLTRFLAFVRFLLALKFPNLKFASVLGLC